MQRSKTSNKSKKDNGLKRAKQRYANAKETRKAHSRETGKQKTKAEKQ